MRKGNAPRRLLAIAVATASGRTVISSGLPELQSGSLREPQPKDLLGLIDAAQLKLAEQPRRPSHRPAASANLEENRICRLSGSQSFSIRTTSLTAGPITVKSRRSAAPTLPYSTSPTCRAISTSAKGRPAASRFELLALDLADASTAASRARRQAALSSGSSNDIVASIASGQRLLSPAERPNHLSRSGDEMALLIEMVVDLGMN